MPTDKTLEQKKLLLIWADQLLGYYNSGLSFSVSGEFFATELMSGKLVEFALKLYHGDFDGALKLASEMGLIEKLSDSCFHFYHGGISKDSSKTKITLAIAFDFARIVMGYYYGSTHTSKIPTVLNYLDLGVNHPVNLVANGMRFAVNYFGFFSSSSKNEISSPVQKTEDVPEGKRENTYN